MVQHREKVLAHAEKELDSASRKSSSELLSLYKKFLKIENHRLRLKHFAGGGGLDIAQQRAGLVDIVLRHLFDSACMGVAGAPKAPEGLSLVAIGGFGRGELNPFSDVDIMFLHDDSSKGISAQNNEIIQSILYMLWDVGFKVGHSTRSLSGAVKQANTDMMSKTSLLESRYVSGDKPLFEQFKIEFEKRCVKGFEKEYIEQRIANQNERHAKYGGSIYMQEPNVKNGCGSLRDYQNLLWISYFKDRTITTAQMVEKKVLSEAERRHLDRAYDFLLRVRTDLHYLNKRALDVVTLAFQVPIANNFRYPQKSALRRNEAFMRDYYQHARSIYYITEALSDRFGSGILAEKKKSVMSLLLPKKRRAKPEYFDGFYAAGNVMYPESREIFKEDPHRMMRLFQHAQQRRLVLSHELQYLIRRRLHMVDRTFNYARANRETFNAILSRKGEVGRILRMMHEVDFLGRYIPEFGRLTCLVQHEFFHRYTADEHTLVCIEKLDQLIDTTEEKLASYRLLFQKLEDPFVLYLALLLHDTGKAMGGRHHAEASAMFAQRVAVRLQLPSERRRALIFLVDNHLVLSSVSQRRNLEDPATIAEFAGIVRTQANLDALMLLTLADGQGTGDENWSDWKEGLVWQLYRSTSHYLADSGDYYRQRKIERDNLRAAVAKKLARDFAEEIAAYFESMPEIYFQTYSAPDVVAQHIRFFRTYLEKRYLNNELSLTPELKWVAHTDKGHSEVWVCTWDRKELLAKIAGSFSMGQLNILNADVFTRTDNLVFDIFRVCNINFEAVTDEKSIAHVEKKLTQALTGEEFDFALPLKRTIKKGVSRLLQELDFPTRIGIDNDAHPVYTLVDIQTPDRLGLLYHILKGFAMAGVNIAMSRITTEKGAAIDSFYVTDFNGQKIDDQKGVHRLQKALQFAVSSTLE